jgi:choline-sulfatase
LAVEFSGETGYKNELCMCCPDRCSAWGGGRPRSVVAVTPADRFQPVKPGSARSGAGFKANAALRIGFVVVCFTLNACSRDRETPPAAPAVKVSQIVLVTIDTLRADRLGAYGYTRKPTSPSLDSWAKDAALFERAFAQAPWTVPSLGSLMTGFYPIEAGVYTNRAHLDPDFTTLAQLFSQQGFRTASFNTHYLLLNGYGGFRRGFADVHPSLGEPEDDRIHKIPFARVEPELMRWLDRHANEKFFVWIHDMTPHEPESEDNPYLQDPDWDAGGDWRPYDPEVRWMDDMFGRLLSKLQALGIAERALIVFTADHGEAFLEHGLPGHQNVIYDEVLRVPLILSYPGMPRAGRIAEPVELIDLFRTICELAGLDAPAAARGESLVPIVEGKREARRRPFSFHSRYHFEHGQHHLAVRDREWKLIVKTPESSQRPQDRPEWGLFAPGTAFELYNFARDPGEEDNLIDEYADVALRLAQSLWAWKQRGDAQLLVGPKRAPAVLDQGTREALRALGYE